MKHSPLQAALEFQMKAAKLPEPVPEYKIVPNRKFRWDYAWPDLKLAVEVNGGIWVQSGHSSGTGIARDAEKLNLAVLEGWRVLVFTKDPIKDGRALRWLTEAIYSERW